MSDYEIFELINDDEIGELLGDVSADNEIDAQELAEQMFPGQPVIVCENSDIWGGRA
jgi:hypothetical protein